VKSPSVLELHVAELKQLFNAMDPAPFHERDLDPNAVQYIVDWAREAHSHVALALVVHVGGGGATPANTRMLGDAVHEHFRRLAVGARQRLRRLFRTGRISLVIGLAFVSLASLAADYLGGVFTRGSTSSILTDSLAIGAAVALWRPLEIFLYDWWPIRSEARLLDRLSQMDVRLQDAATPARAGS
jgi:hypothetical protein